MNQTNVTPSSYSLFHTYQGQNHHNEFYEILKDRKITTLFQPIISLETGLPFGFEALTRGPVESYFFNPIHLFSYAETADLLFPLEKIARESAFKNSLPLMNNGQKLFINLSSKVIHDPTFTPGHTVSLLEKFNLTPNDIVFEITERHAIEDFKTFREALNHYRNQGFLIAVDDAGAGYSSAQAISELSPDFIKIDRSLIDGVFHSSVKEGILEAFVSIAKRMNSKLIAEGIENIDDLEAVIKLGFDFAQGFLISKPVNFIPSLPDRVHSTITNYQSKSRCNEIGTLTIPTITVDISCNANCITQHFLRNPTLTSIVITSDKSAYGLVKRELWMNQPEIYRVFQQLCKTNVQVVDIHTDTQMVAQIIFSRNIEDTYDDIIVTENEIVVGIVPVRDVFRYLYKGK